MASIELKSWSEVFPTGLPPPPPAALAVDFEVMDLNLFEAWLLTQVVGKFVLQVSNLNPHVEQRTPDLDWVDNIRQNMIETDVKMYSFPGVAVSNTLDLPLDDSGLPDPTQITASIMSGLHRTLAAAGLDDKVYFFTVYSNCE
jgi:hypothetical protein